MRGCIVPKGSEMLEGVCWIGIGGIVSLAALRTGLGSFSEPGGGFIAFLCGMALCVVGGIMAIARLAAKHPEGKAGLGGSVSHIMLQPRLLYVVGCLLCYVVLVRPLGYVLTTFLLLWAMTYNRERRNVLSSFGFSLVVVTGSYVVFELWLGCQLPHGLFPWW